MPQRLKDQVLWSSQCATVALKVLLVIDVSTYSLET